MKIYRLKRFVLTLILTKLIRLKYGFYLNGIQKEILKQILSIFKHFNALPRTKKLTSMEKPKGKHSIEIFGTKVF